MQLASTTISRSAPQLLIADDLDLNLDVLGTFFSSKGWQVQCANSGLQALQRAGTDYFDFLLFDIRMPGLCGDEVLAALRKDPSAASHRSPAAAMTAELDALPDSARPQFEHIFLKPLKIAEIYQALGNRVSPISKVVEALSSPSKTIGSTLTEVQVQKMHKLLAKDLIQKLPQIKNDFLEAMDLFAQSANANALFTSKLRDHIHRLIGALGIAPVPAMQLAAERFRYAPCDRTFQNLTAEIEVFLARIESINSPGRALV